MAKHGLALFIRTMTLSNKHHNMQADMGVASRLAGDGGRERGGGKEASSQKFAGQRHQDTVVAGCVAAQCLAQSRRHQTGIAGAISCASSISSTGRRRGDSRWDCHCSRSVLKPPQRLCGFSGTPNTSPCSRLKSARLLCGWLRGAPHRPSRYVIKMPPKPIRLSDHTQITCLSHFRLAPSRVTFSD